MKLSLLFLAGAILVVSAGPLSETPSVRGASLTTISQFSSTVLTLSSVTTQGKAKLAAVAIIQMLQMSFWFTSTTSQLTLNIDEGATCGTNVNLAMGLGFPATQAKNIKTHFEKVVKTMRFSVDAVKGADAVKGQAMQTKLTQIEAEITTITTELTTVSQSASIFSTLFMLVSDQTVQKMTVVVLDIANLQNDCAVAFSDSNSENHIPALLMDIVIATTSSAKKAAVIVVQSIVNETVTISASSVQSVTAIEVVAMQQTTSVAQTSMTTTTNCSSTAMALVVVGMHLQTQFDVQLVVTQVATISEGDSSCVNETMVNITSTQEEFTSMCSNSSDSDEVSMAAKNVTVLITTVVESESSIIVQMCASVAISAIVIEQHNAHMGIGQCVSEGKRENDKDMADIQANFTGSTMENTQNLTRCCNKYADPLYSGNAPSNSDSGTNKDERIQSCMRRHTDKDHKKSKANSDEKCKKHKKGGENHERVKKCKADRKTASVTTINEIHAQFQVCKTMSG